MRTLTSTFCRSSSHPLITFHAQHSELFTVLLDSLIIHRLSNTSTQQFDNSRPLSCTSIQMRSQKENLILIHRKTCTSSTTRAVLAISSSQKLKEMVGSFSESRPRSPQSLSFISAIRAPLDLRRSGKKKHQSAKLNNSFLFSPYPRLSHCKLSLEASAILHNQPAILHDGIADPSHNSKPPHKLLTHSLQPPCKPPNTSFLSQINQASHSRVQ